jgi:CheY-like chemotaxis protein
MLGCWIFLRSAKGFSCATGTDRAKLIDAVGYPSMNFSLLTIIGSSIAFSRLTCAAKGHVASSLTDSSKVESWLDLNPCDAVILDIGMPKVDGLTLITIIREKYADLPIVMFTWTRL